MNIAIEIDSIICTPVSSTVALIDVEECQLLPGTVEALNKMKEQGHIIMLYTTRDASLGPDTEMWLQRNKVPYDKIIFNKLEFDIILDRKAHKFDSWQEFTDKYKYHLGNN